MKILISNDDGWQAPGIVALANAVASFADIKVVAPDRNRSAASNSLTLMHPIRATEQKPDWFSVDGTPVDCVNLALNGLFDWAPDMVVTGINAGPNLGDDVLYSGTVAAATEGFFHGIPAIAFSLVDCIDGYEQPAQIAADIIQRCCNDPLLKEHILSVNVPRLGPQEDVILSATRLGRRGRFGAAANLHATDPRGEKIYWIGAVGKPEDNGAGTDFNAVDNGRVSLTPITVDMTAHDRIAPLAKLLGGSV